MKPDRKALGLDVCTKNTLFYGGGGDETAVCTIMTYCFLFNNLKKTVSAQVTCCLKCHLRTKDMDVSFALIMSLSLAPDITHKI